MSWIVFSLLGALIYTFVNFIDKYLVEHRVKDSRCMPIYGAITSIVFGSAVWLLNSFPTLTTRNSLLVLAAGVLSMFGSALYFYGLSKSHTSYIIALLQTWPIFTLIFSFFILHEGLNYLQLTGFLVMILAILGLSIDKVERKVKLNKPFYAIILANVFFALGAVIIRFTVNLDSFAPILVYESWGLAFGGLMIFIASKSIRGAFINSLRTISKPTLGIVFFNEGLFSLAKAVTFFAITLGPVALVSVLGGTQVFFGFLLGAGLTFVYPKLFHEDIAKRDIAKKLLLSVVLCIGVWLISRS